MMEILKLLAIAFVLICVIDLVIRSSHNFVEGFMPAPRYKKASFLIPDRFAVRGGVRYFYTDKEF